MPNESAPENNNLLGQRITAYIDKFFAATFTLSLVGATNAFNKMDLGEQRESGGGHLFYASMAWLFFNINFAVIGFAASALAFYRIETIHAFESNIDSKRRSVTWYAVSVCTVIFLLLVAAYMCLGLVLVQYQKSIGWASIVATCAFGVAGLGCAIWQVSTVKVAEPKMLEDGHDN
jgi:hypothetical protein